MAIAVGILMIYILGYIFPVLAHTPRHLQNAPGKMFLIDFRFAFHEILEQLALRERNFGHVLRVHACSCVFHSRISSLANFSRP
jgi:hypothetical protein